jgi:hypothetical protein
VTGRFVWPLSLSKSAQKHWYGHHYHWDPLSYIYTCKIIKKSTHTLGQFWNSLSTSWRSDPCGILELLPSLGSKYATSTPAKNMYGARNSKWNTVSSLLLLSHISDLTILNMWDSLLLSSTCSLVIVVYESSFKLKVQLSKTDICKRRVPFPCVAGHRCTHRNCVRSHKSVRQTDWTTQHAYPTVKCTKQLQIMHVARTVTAERGPTCACRQRMADSCPCLICVSSLAFGEG